MADEIPPAKPRWNLKTRIDRKWFITLTLLSWLIALGAIWLFVFKYPAYVMWAFVIALVLTAVDYALRIFRMNDISSETQMKYWKSGNMFFVNGWMHWLAPSSSSTEGSLGEIVSSPLFTNREERLKLIGRNFLRWFIVWGVLMAIVFGYWFYNSWSMEQQALNQPPSKANIVLSLGNNETTTLSMTVPGGYVGGNQIGAGTIFPTSSLNRETPGIGFYSGPATPDHLKALAQQTILNTETQIHYADNDKLTVRVATGTFLGYPAWIMTSKSDRPAKTIAFQVGSSTNIIEIRIIYSSSDPASERQVVDDLLNSIKISNGLGTTTQNNSELFPVPPSLTILSPNGGETWQMGQRQIIKWTSVGVKSVSIYIRFSNGILCAVNRSGILPASPGEFSFVLTPTCFNGPDMLTSGQYTVNIADSDPGSNDPEAESSIFSIVAP